MPSLLNEATSVIKTKTRSADSLFSSKAPTSQILDGVGGHNRSSISRAKGYMPPSYRIRRTVLWRTSALSCHHSSNCGSKCSKSYPANTKPSVSASAFFAEDPYLYLRQRKRHFPERDGSAVFCQHWKRYDGLESNTSESSHYTIWALRLHFYLLDSEIDTYLPVLRICNSS